MPKINDLIKNETKGIEMDTEHLIIEQTLNSLFYKKPKYKRELKMLKMQYQQKQTSGDRVGLHASNIIASENDFCYRAQLLSLFFKQLQGENVQIGLKRIFEAGTSIGEKWQRLFIRGDLGNIDDMDITRFCKKYDMTYTPDAVIKIGKKLYVVEIKSQNTFQFKKANSHPSGMKQLKFYMWLTGIHNGFVLVEDKNDQNFKIYLANDYHVSDVEPYIERLEFIKRHKKEFVENKKAPKRKCKSSDVKRALNCNMQNVCWNVNNSRIRLDKC